MTKAELRSIRDLNVEREKLLAMIKKVETVMYSPRAPQNTGLPRGKSENPIEELVIRHEVLISEYTDKVQKLIKEICKIEAVLDKLPSKERTLCRLYYIENLTWEQVCVEMNYSWTQIHRIHASALRLLQTA